ncbi:MAG: zinc dependent phospholipase C family protein [Patescibacteria group bacterium]
MPKEGTHQYIAKKVQTLFIPKNLDTYLYGSLAPDIFFFDFIKKPTVSNRLHGKDGESTDQIFLTAGELWPKLDKADRVILADFLAGYLTHVITDRVFHPWVIYWSGGPAEEKKYGSIVHHFLETWLDLALDNPQPPIKYDRQILRLYKNIIQPEQNIYRCAWQHKFLVRSLDSTWFLQISRREPALLTLSYKIVKKYISQYHLGDLSTWRQPVTGEPKNISWQGLLAQSIDLSRHLLEQIDWSDLPSNDWETLLGAASLETNLVGVPFSDCRFQNTEYFSQLRVGL